ncbi:MAG: hypothetical protein AB7P21_05380 [Lautropia sp.]
MNRGAADADANPGIDPAARLATLLAAQRDALLEPARDGGDACAGAERLEAIARALADTLLPLQPIGASAARAPLTASQCRALRAALDGNRVALNRLRAANQRALDTLFGERAPSRYGPAAWSLPGHEQQPDADRRL